MASGQGYASAGYICTSCDGCASVTAVTRGQTLSEIHATRDAKELLQVSLDLATHFGKHYHQTGDTTLYLYVH